ncbi:MAG: hypothetical protein JWM47_341 [Acidimicrobiales bacterium]|nr:hypothetical protein [Acidimicrobiales bacterium]
MTKNRSMKRLGAAALAAASLGTSLGLGAAAPAGAQSPAPAQPEIRTPNGPEPTASKAKKNCGFLVMLIMNYEDNQLGTDWDHNAYDQTKRGVCRRW